MKLFSFLFFLGSFFSLFGGKEITLTHDWEANSCDPSFIQKSYLKDIHTSLKRNRILLRPTNLQGERDHSALSFVVIWNRPSFLKNKILERFPKNKRLLFAWESPVVQPKLYSPSFLNRFKRIYTWNDDLVDNKRFFKFYYPVLLPYRDALPSFEDRKLLIQVSSNKNSSHPKELYTERKKVIAFFEENGEEGFDFYGHGWSIKDYKNCRGELDDKLHTLKKYRFSICYENMRDVKGYITEKIFDSFAVGTVPIYWGASNIEEYVPKSCFIDRRDFKDFAELYHYIKAIDRATYETYLRNIQTFLESNQAKFFSPQLFEVIFLEAVRFR